MKRIFTLAQAYSVRVVPHCFYWGPGYNATAHLAASRPEPTLLETAFIDLIVQPHGLFDASESSLDLSEKPGLGFEADWEALSSYVISSHSISG
jgi:L-alanine-DL-glutamate epimerase-like enolase superfamily enzyme